MTESEFKTNMRAAKTFVTVLESDFWNGYIAGIRRHYHGDNFGSINHNYLMKGNDMKSDGYRMGFCGISAAHSLNYLTTKKVQSDFGRMGGMAKSAKKAKSSAANGKLGGRPRKHFYNGS
jgi:hypothetical protein